MIQRIANAIITRLLPFVKEAVREEFEHRQKADAKQVRELVGEMEDVLEKFSRVVAREGMRRARAMKQSLESNAGEEAAVQTPPLPATALSGKAAIRARMAAGRTKLVAEG